METKTSIPSERKLNILIVQDRKKTNKKIDKHTNTHLNRGTTQERENKTTKRHTTPFPFPTLSNPQQHKASHTKPKQASKPLSTPPRFRPNAKHTPPTAKKIKTKTPPPLSNELARDVLK